jgi:hypothetical protein
VCDLCVLCDNQACIKIVRNPMYSAKSKHIDIQHHFVREREAEGEVRIEHCAATQDMVADVMTEPVARAVLSGRCGTLGVCCRRLMKKGMQLPRSRGSVKAVKLLVAARA